MRFFVVLAVGGRGRSSIKLKFMDSGGLVKILATTCPSGGRVRGSSEPTLSAIALLLARPSQMLENMFVGRPRGNYDRLLDFSRALTGSLFFAPSVTFLQSLGRGDPREQYSCGSLHESSIVRGRNRATRLLESTSYIFNDWATHTRLLPAGLPAAGVLLNRRIVREA